MSVRRQTKSTVQVARLFSCPRHCSFGHNHSRLNFQIICFLKVTVHQQLFDEQPIDVSSYFRIPKNVRFVCQYVTVIATKLLDRIFRNFTHEFLGGTSRSSF